MGLMTPLAVRIGAISWMPRLLPQIVWTDTRLQRLTRGRLTLLDIAGLPNMMLTVPGRKSGIPRSTPLLCVPDGDTWLIAGSNFGGPVQPVWVVNLEAVEAAGGTAEVRVKGRTTVVHPARLAGEERAAAWSHMLRTWPNYDHYARRTDREIKVFRLTPVA